MTVPIEAVAPAPRRLLEEAGEYYSIDPQEIINGIWRVAERGGLSSTIAAKLNEPADEITDYLVRVEVFNSFLGALSVFTIDLFARAVKLGAI